MTLYCSSTSLINSNQIFDHPFSKKTDHTAGRRKGGRNTRPGNHVILMFQIDKIVEENTLAALQFKDSLPRQRTI